MAVFAVGLVFILALAGYAGELKFLFQIFLHFFCSSLVLSK